MVAHHPDVHMHTCRAWSRRTCGHGVAPRLAPVWLHWRPHWRLVSGPLAGALGDVIGLRRGVVVAVIVIVVVVIVIVITLRQEVVAMVRGQQVSCQRGLRQEQQVCHCCQQVVNGEGSKRRGLQLANGNHSSAIEPNGGGPKIGGRDAKRTKSKQRPWGGVGARWGEARQRREGCCLVG